MVFSSSVMAMSLGSHENEEGDSDADWLQLLSQSRFEKRKLPILQEACVKFSRYPVKWHLRVTKRVVGLLHQQKLSGNTLKKYTRHDKQF